MKLLVLSDTHFEFHRDSGIQFISSLTRDIDVAIFAGDLDNSIGLRRSLTAICQHFDGIPVIYVNGNHDFYKSDRDSVIRTIDALSTKYLNLVHLDNIDVTIYGQQFIGTPLWFKNDPLNTVYQDMLNDFHLIYKYEEWVYKENKKAVKFLEDKVRDNSIVISHHIPYSQGVPPHYRTDALNRFFLCDMSNLILDRKPKAWIFGHTHTFLYDKLGDTKMICNPLGYPSEDTGYIDNLVIEV